MMTCEVACGGWIDEVEMWWWLHGGLHRAMVPAMMDGMGFVVAMKCGWKSRARRSIGGLVW